jgi:sigma-B regulation protein RsbU (phosphoserine phosphatase)
VEARAADGAFYGEQRLVSALASEAGRTAPDIAAALLADVLDFQNGIARDDIAIVALKVPAESASG